MCFFKWQKSIETEILGNSKEVIVFIGIYYVFLDLEDLAFFFSICKVAHGNKGAFSFRRNFLSDGRFHKINFIKCLKFRHLNSWNGLLNIQTFKMT